MWKPKTPGTQVGQHPWGVCPAPAIMKQADLGEHQRGPSGSSWTSLGKLGPSLWGKAVGGIMAVTPGETQMALVYTRQGPRLAEGSGKHPAHELTRSTCQVRPGLGAWAGGAQVAATADPNLPYTPTVPAFHFRKPGPREEHILPRGIWSSSPTLPPEQKPCTLLVGDTCLSWGR